MDICLSDPDSIRDALKVFDKNSENLEGSIIEIMTLGDQVRKDTFKDIELYPTNHLLSLDLNLRGTIERSQECNSFKSLK